MKRYSYILSLLALLAIPSCTEDFSPTDLFPRVGKTMKVTATIGGNPDTKTTVHSNGTSIYWTEGDAINLFYGSTLSGQFTTDIDSPQATAEFTGTFSGNNVPANETASFWGVYPYDESNTCDGTSVTLTIPAVQESSPGTFATGLNPSVANSADGTLTFYNVGSWFVFSVTQTGVTSATLTGNKGEVLAGRINVTMNSDNRPTATLIDEAASSITINAPAGGFVPGSLYYIVLIPQDLEDGYSLALHKGANVAICKIEKPVSFSRAYYRKKENADNNASYVLEAIDLGLSVKWAACNLGASAPEENGDYYAWGETESKSDYSIDTYKWWDGSNNTLTKYNCFSSWGAVDSRTVLEAEDDAAQVKLGDKWRMPTSTEWKELIETRFDTENYTWTWCDGSDVKYNGSTAPGWKVVRNGTLSTIFLPASGEMYGTDFYTLFTGYWLSSLSPDYFNISPASERPYAWGACFDGTYGEYPYCNSSIDRKAGFSIRPVYGDFVRVSSISLNKSSLEIFVGNTETLTATVNPADATEKTVVWASDNRSVASVSEGTIAAKSAGTVTISAMANGQCATCVVTVNPVLVTGVSLNKTSTSLHVGSAESLSATVTPSNATNKNVSWSSSNTSVATVDDKGLIIGKSTGTARITVRTEDGSKTAFCDVTVTPLVSPQAVDLGLSVKWASLNLGASAPEEYGNYYAWGEIEPKSVYNWSTYKWCNGSSYSLTKYCTNPLGKVYGTEDGKHELEATDDAVIALLGGHWRMPTLGEFSELANTQNDTDNYSWIWCDGNTVKYNGSSVAGWMIVRIENNATIFLPAAGHRESSNHTDEGSKGYYLTSMLYSFTPNTSDSYWFYSSLFHEAFLDRSKGSSIRPVYAE